MIDRGQGIRGGFKSFLTVVSSSIIVQTHADTLTRDDMSNSTGEAIFSPVFCTPPGAVVGRSGNPYRRRFILIECRDVHSVLEAPWALRLTGRETSGLVPFCLTFVMAC